jgi:hypothetical protein
VVHVYWQMEQRRDSQGNVTTEQIEHESIVSDVCSAAPFAVVDATGQVAIAPQGADISSGSSGRARSSTCRARRPTRPGSSRSRSPTAAAT